jgi:hypothetical protein
MEFVIQSNEYNRIKVSESLTDYWLFYVPLKNFSLIRRRHHCRWRAAKFRPMLGAQGLWAGRDLYRATPAVIRDLFFRSHPKDRPIQLPLTHEGVWWIYSKLDQVSEKPLQCERWFFVVFFCFFFNTFYTLNDWRISNTNLTSQY